MEACPIELEVHQRFEKKDLEEHRQAGKYVFVNWELRR
jgi:hypothetical protein